MPRRRLGTRHLLFEENRVPREPGRRAMFLQRWCGVRAELFADRFLVTGCEQGLDLASGERVTIRFVTFDEEHSLHDWLGACASRLWLETGGSPPLCDFGLAGHDRHFEAVSVAVPGAAARRTASTHTEGRERACAMITLLEQLAEVLDGGVCGRPRTLDLALPHGIVRRAAVNAVARESRLRGYLPVHPARIHALAPGTLSDSLLAACLHGRHVTVLHDGPASCRAEAARWFVTLGLDSDRPHVLLGLRDAEPRCDHPPPFAGPRPRPSVAGAREEPAVYGPLADEFRAPAGLPSLDGVVRWPARATDAESARPRQRLLQALDAASRGRHTAATRTIREALTMLIRRGDALGAAESAFALGRVLLSRGQVADAAGAFEQARRLFDEGGVQESAVLSAVHVGFAWTDGGRWLEAEAAARAAVIAATGIGDREAGRLARLALARCLLWQERAREAADALPGEEPDGGGNPPKRLAESPPPWADLRAKPALDFYVARHCLASRIAAAVGDVAGAGRAAARARERAVLVGRPLETAAACTCMASVYARLGDMPAVRVQVEEGLRAARHAHAPLRGIRLRAVLASALLHGGKLAEARPLIARLSRLDLATLPVVVRRPIEELLLWKPGRTPATADPAGRDVVDTVVELLALCETVAEEEGLARKAVATLRARLAAVAATCFGLADERVVPLAMDGRDPSPVDVAQRAAETGLAVAPGGTTTGLEAAVPVRFGGRIIGALGCRWAADAKADWPTASAILAAAAAVLAPSVRAVLDRRAVPLAAAAAASLEPIVGVSEAIGALRTEIERAARAPFNVVIEGESGTGKELVARAIHRLGPRCHHRLCAINCAAMTEELLDAELFGHARGAFTGAVAERKGLFEEADGGTLVLDEVSELSPRAQAKLLRAIQEGEVRRVGENLPRLVDARIVAASNRSLRAAVEAGTFRRDLLYRLEVIRVVVPPLRERLDDIPLLAAHFWREATGRLGSRATLAPSALAALARYDWPGNVRELQNVMAALAVSAGRRGSVGAERLPSAIACVATNVRGATLEEARRVFEARYVKAALARAGGQRAQAARELGVTRQGLAKLLARLEIA